MVIRVMSCARLALLILVSLTMSFVGTTAFSNDHFVDMPQHDTHALHASSDEVAHATGHDHHSLTGVERHLGHHDDHVGECHTNLCCVMDCPFDLEGSSEATELIASSNTFAVVAHTSLSQLVPERPPRI